MECICEHVNGGDAYWRPMHDFAMPPLINYHLPMFSSAVAAQIAWWLSFFPSEQFLILTSSELRTQEGAIRVRRLRVFALSNLCWRDLPKRVSESVPVGVPLLESSVGVD